MKTKKGKIIVLSAPSGTGKSTIIASLMQQSDLNLGFSISATCRLPRSNEKHGREYYFLTADEFRQYVNAGKFVEWEEVYPGCCYGTLFSEVKRVTESGKNLIMDIDVKGALNIKERFGPQAICIFIAPPSLSELARRLRDRKTDSEEVIAKRLSKAEYELGFSSEFDKKVINDSLPEAIEEVSEIIRDFTKMS